MHGDIGWEFWCQRRRRLPAAHYRPAEERRRGHVRGHHLQAGQDGGSRIGAGACRARVMVYRSPIVRMRQLFDLVRVPAALQGLSGEPPQLQRGHRSWWCSARIPRTCTPGWSSIPVPDELAETLGRLSKSFAPFQKLPGDEYAVSCKINTRAGSERITAGRLRVRPRPRPQEGHHRPQGQRGAGYRRALPGRRRGRWPRTSPIYRWTTPTSTPSACGCSRTRSTTTCWWRQTCTATSSPTSVPRWWEGLGFGCSGNIGKQLAVFEPTHGSAPKYAGQNKVNPIATILAAKMMLDWLGEGEGGASGSRGGGSHRRGRGAHVRHGRHQHHHGDGRGGRRQAVARPEGRTAPPGPRLGDALLPAVQLGPARSAVCGRTTRTRRAGRRGRREEDRRCCARPSWNGGRWWSRAPTTP